METPREEGLILLDYRVDEDEAWVVRGAKHMIEDLTNRSTACHIIKWVFEESIFTVEVVDLIQVFRAQIGVPSLEFLYSQTNVDHTFIHNEPF